MKTNLKKIMAVVMVITCMLVVFTGCGNSRKKYAGSYVSTEGGIMVLNSDGKCSVKQNNWKNASEGSTWEYKKGVITIHDAYDYDIYATVSKDNPKSLLFKADTKNWNDELYIKSN